MFCRKCGNKFLDNEKFCAKCGSARNGSGEENILEETSQSKDSTKEKNLKGLGGWLILVLLGLLYTLYIYSSAVISSSKMFTDGTVEQLSYIQGYAGALGFEVVMQFIFALAAMFLIFLFFKKSKRFPKFFIIFLFANIIFITIDTVMMSSLSFPAEIKDAMQEIIDEGYGQLVKSIIGSVIWTWYMKVSKRVKLTFIE